MQIKLTVEQEERLMNYDQALWESNCSGLVFTPPVGLTIGDLYRIFPEVQLIMKEV